MGTTTGMSVPLSKSSECPILPDIKRQRFVVVTHDYRDPSSHRRFQLWQRSGRLDRLLQRLAEDLRDRGKVDLSDAFVDASFASAKKGALKSVQRAVAMVPLACARILLRAFMR
jgi:hypothetical protein